MTSRDDMSSCTQLYLEFDKARVSKDHERAAEFLSQLLEEIATLLAPQYARFCRKFPDAVYECGVADACGKIYQKLRDGQLGYDRTKGSFEAFVGTSAENYWKDWGRQNSSRSKKEVISFNSDEGLDMDTFKYIGATDQYEEIANNDWQKHFLSCVDEQDLALFFQVIIETGEYRPRFLKDLLALPDEAAVNNLKKRAKRWLLNHLGDFPADLFDKIGINL